ncbi:MAG: CapA family protein [Gammaproteobacteria bacterium]|nr:CapA family protein [Gammaproteobacteria bacterium]MBT8109565.1 CapA family protein [Gammaproteobacteria bacterium]NND46158.1 CapA family protein [Woeseiaceae bacterium]NNL44267.1 CapA family protein [Woeseiaceae bacterium]
MTSLATSCRPLAAVALLLLAACATSPAPDAPPARAPAPPEEVPQAVTPLPPLPDKATLRLSIASVGDMMIGTDYPQNHLPDDDGIGFLAAVAPYLSSADVTFGNLEGVLLDGGQPGKKCSNPSACYLFRSPTRYAYHYRSAGFDVLSLANNHARDFGEEGRSSSMQAIAAAGMHHSGRVDDFASFEVNGISVAVLAYAVTKNSNMMLDYELAFETVARFAGSHDIVMVSFHGGAEGADVTHIPFADEEYYGEPRGDVVWFARGVIDAGADLVIGHGPHVVRGVERYKDRLIAYSLGNFATYYGISVAGIKGIAPILTTTLDGTGAFVEGNIVSTIQLRPDGPSIDPKQRALNLMRELSIEDFGEPGLTFLPDGRLLPAPRPRVQPHILQTLVE